MSSISGIPNSLYEAASLDGANVVQKFFNITLPSIKSPLLYSLVMGTIGGFNVYGQTYMFAGPSNTHSLMQYIQEYAFGSATSIAGMASAMSVMLGVIISVFSLIQFKLMKGND
jgi:multiple sugar transport system permease protein